MNHHKVRLILAYIISFMPFNKLRCFFYNKALGYKVVNSYIGWATVMAVNYAEIIESSIGKGNKFIGPMKVIVNRNSKIGGMNSFICGWWVKEEKFKSVGYECCLYIGKETLITSHHYFDVVGTFKLGDFSWIAGAYSQFWTHGAGVQDRNVIIGERCYIGSAVRFAPGASIGNNCIVGIGSVVTKKLLLDNTLIVGQPAKVIRENYDWKNR